MVVQKQRAAGLKTGRIEDGRRGRGREREKGRVRTMMADGAAGGEVEDREGKLDGAGQGEHDDAG